MSKATRIPTSAQRAIIDALEWAERSNVSITLAAVLGLLIVVIGLLAAYKQ